MILFGGQMIHLQFQEVLILLQLVLIIAELLMLIIALILMQLVLIIADLLLLLIIALMQLVDNFSNEAGATIAAFGGCNIVYTTSSDSGTITCQDVVLEAMVIDIAPRL